MEVKAEYRTIFAEEAKEHLQEWEQSLLSLEQEPENAELIHEMFRAIHTLKGSAGFIGFEKLQKVCHDLESALQEVREGALKLNPQIIELLFRGLDLCTRMVAGFTAGEEFGEDIEGFLGQLWEQKTSQQESAAVSAASAEAAADGAAASGAAGDGSVGAVPRDSSRRRFQVHLHVASSGREAYLRAFLIRNRMSAVGTVVSEDPPPEILRDSGGRFDYKVVIETDQDETALREALNVDQVEIAGIAEQDEQTKASEPASEEGEGKTESETDTQNRSAKAEEVVRVSVERLDTLLNLVGELVIQNSGFITIAQDLKSEYGKSSQILDLEGKTEVLSKITRDLQDGIMKVRMLPVNTVFSRFYRVVRDLAKDRKKEITLQVYGEETEIDKKVMDRIGDPLVHLIRNAADHGIESREERLAAGKAPVGLIRLGAYQEGDHICIEVSDDGRGLDRDGVLRKAVQTGLVRGEEAERLGDEQILSLIFLPGFSTARKVSEVSGRGVGMDVVKRAIEAMGGSIRIRSSVGKGTGVTISLPLTMAIIPAVMVEVSGSTLAVPLSAVKEVLKVGEGEMSSVGTRPAIRLREEVLAVVHLRDALQLEANGGGERGGRTPIVIVDYEDKKIGLGVERVIGTGEIVIKSLSRHYREIEGLIGASILGNGRIALIVDVEALVRQYYHVDGSQHSFSDSSVFSFQDNMGQDNMGRAGWKEQEEAGSTREGRQSPSQGPAETGEGPAEAAAAPEAGMAVEAEEEGGSPPEQASPQAPEPEQEEEAVQDLVEELNRSKGVLLEEVHNEGAIQASMALSSLTGKEVRVSFPESQLVKLSEVVDLLGGDEMPVGGIFVGVAGGLEGGILIVLPVEGVLLFHDRMHGRPAGTSSSIDEVDMSAISEFGNILSASFINAISNGTKLSVKSASPEIIVDMCEAVIDSVLARFNQPGERILITEAVIYSDEDEQAACHLLMFLEPESLKVLTATLVDDLDGPSQQG